MSLSRLKQVKIQQKQPVKSYIREGQQLVLGLTLGLSLILSGVGCGKKSSSPIESLISHLKLNTYELNGNQWAQAVISVSTGGYILTGVNIPVSDPSDHSKVYGQLTILPNMCWGQTACENGGDIFVSLNITQISQTKGIEPTLPNGTAIPIAGLDKTTIIVVPIGDKSTHTRLYFAFAPGIALMGTAISFAGLDPAGRAIPNVNVFQPLRFGPVNLIAGIYTGEITKTTGIGIFIDLSGVLNKVPGGGDTTTPPPAALLAELRNGVSRTSLEAPGALQSPIEFKPVGPSAKVRDKLFRKLYELSQKRTELKVQ